MEAVMSDYKPTIREAIKAGIDTTRASGGNVSPKAMAYLERAANGELSLDEVRGLLMKDIEDEKRNNSF
ncbi:MAG: hypothetical protein CSB48_05065 [Proteobacteria bacterium]|nr:MAG: hypothetical protein CSB48_05065 [Pseudomonadota bacterium]PIE40272.1 MAG: hypothetical protein CSA51_01695 [Gammaproteobacteria bacterium]